MKKDFTTSVTFSESEKVAIGDYESQDVFVSLTDAVQDDETIEEAYKRVKKIVKKQVNKEAKKIRLWSKGWVDFDTKAKIR